MTQQHTVVFGGAGFIGSTLLRALAEKEGSAATSVDVAPPRRPLPGVRYVTADVREPLDVLLDPVLDGGAPATRVYNFAAVHTTPGHPHDDYYEANVRGAMNVLAFARRHAVPEVVFTSSISVYGPTEAVADETSPLAAVSSYGKSKKIAEELHRTWQEEEPGSRRLVVVRPAVVFGHGEGGNFERLRAALHKRRFVYPGRTDTVKSCIYVGELLRTLDWALEQGRPSITYNAAYPERCTIEEIVTAIHEIDGAPLPPAVVPYPIVSGAAKVLQAARRLGAPDAFHPERVRKLYQSTNIFPKVLVDEGYPFATDLRGGIKAWLADAAADGGGRP